MRYLMLLLLFLFSQFCLQAQSGNVREIIQVLTSDSLAGRGYVDNGQKKSADYISKLLLAYGIPHVEQKLQYPVNTFPEKTIFSSEKVVFEPGRDFLIHPSSGSINFRKKNYIELSEDSLDLRYCQSKKVYLLTKTPDNSAATSDFIEDFLSSKKINNSLLIVQDTAKLSWFPSQIQSSNAVLFLKPVLKNSRLTAKWNAVLKKDFSSSNIIAKISGNRNDSAYMFTAHYDHLGKMGNQALFPGANDNASGVAMLLSLAEHFSANPPKYDTWFLFTTAEEIGLLGSRFFIENPAFDLRTIKLLINLDLVGTGEEGITIVNATSHPQVVEKLEELNNNNRIEKIKKRGPACNSDHCLFDQLGIPAIFIYTLGGKKAYHDVYDTAEGLSLHAFDDLHQILVEFSLQY